MQIGLFVCIGITLSLCPKIAAQINFNYTSGRCLTDVVFVLDQSSSMTADDFRFITDFTASLISSIDTYGPDGVQVGLIKFSTDSYVIFNFNTYADKINASLATKRTKHEGGVTNTHLALVDLRQLFMSGRQNVTKIALLITDGTADDIYLTELQAISMKSQGIVFAIIGIGNILEDYELKALVSRPNLYLPLQDFSQLNSTKPTLDELICGTKCTNGTINIRRLPPTLASIEDIAAVKVNLSEILVSSKPFVPTWCMTGIVFNNDTVTKETVLFLEESLVMLNESLIISEVEKVCYRRSLEALKVELTNDVIESARIIRLIQCTLKVQRLVTDMDNGQLIEKGIALSDMWRQIINATLIVEDADKAVLLVKYKKRKISELESKLKIANEDQKSLIVQEINNINETIKNYEKKIEYNYGVKQLSFLLEHSSKCFDEITSLQNEIITLLQLITNSSRDEDELSASMEALNAANKAHSLNKEYNTLLSSLRSEEKTSTNISSILHYQQRLKHTLNQMLFVANVDHVKVDIQNSIDQLNSTLTTNSLISLYSSKLPALRETQNASLNNVSYIVLFQKEILQNLQHILRNTEDSQTRNSLVSDIKKLEAVIALNSTKLTLDRITIEFENATVLQPLDLTNVKNILMRLVNQYKVVKSLTSSVAEISLIESEIKNIERHIQCL